MVLQIDLRDFYDAETKGNYGLEELSKKLSKIKRKKIDDTLVIISKIFLLYIRNKLNTNSITRHNFKDNSLNCIKI